MNIFSDKNQEKDNLGVRSIGCKEGQITTWLSARGARYTNSLLPEACACYTTDLNKQ